MEACCQSIDNALKFMKCELCKKHSATIHIQEIVNGQKKSLHICAECAAEKAQENPVLQGINLAEMLYNISGHLAHSEDASDDDASSEQGKPAIPGITCPKCGWDTVKFRKTGRLGCTECYQVFHEILCDALKAMHRGTLHVGKRPGHSDEADETGRLMMQIMDLQKEIEEHIKREEYEQAAVLRDRIAELRQKAHAQPQET
jgi:protein arginine kinase activator